MDSISLNAQYKEEKKIAKQAEKRKQTPSSKVQL
jgi:hypothetical protein